MTLNLRGRVSWFGGPDDYASGGVSETEGLAFIFDVDTAPHLFLNGATEALARNLNPAVPYIACRWNYDDFPKEMLASMEHVALVRAPKTGRAFCAWPADWGPAGPESDHDTGRVADISPGLMEYLGIQTDDEVEVTFPYVPEARGPNV
jgi:hypothetical protein